ncbi:hypothetical protein ATN89_17705 [Comamonas thiooxydans]|uniref:FitA-like ribbon-helix-helix domain-containing protein n=1 Tax=Comamonas thiooxydans TaxID=363952 RepID=UPI0007CC0425|nr:hypothetical protein [Comamonas thiooxydans]OAD82918.1 hypothetical protein ATN89_17705 [Comamonas thiooxydans]
MSTLTIRKFPDSARIALKLRAKRNARSMEEEARLMLSELLMPEPRTRTGFGDALAAIGARYSITDDDVGLVESFGNDEIANPMNLEEFFGTEE